MKNGRYKMEFGGEKRASRIFRSMKIDVFDANFHMERSKKSDIVEKQLKSGHKYFHAFD